MEEQSSKRRGRPRKVVSASEVGGEVGGDIAQQPGIGETGPSGIESQRDIIRASQESNGMVISYNEMVDEVLSERRQVVRFWHPDKFDSIIHAKNGAGIEVCVGNPAYQLTTGEIIEV